MNARPEELHPRVAVKRYLDSRGSELTTETISTYFYRLKLWAEWCEEQRIYEVGDLSGWVFERFQSHRAGKGVSPSTLHNEMETLKGHIEYLERIEAVDDGLAEKIHVPDIPQHERSRDERLDPEVAKQLLRHYRQTPHQYATKYHVLLEVLWHTGCRLGAVRSLDLRDFHPGEQYLEFVHRPSTDTPLKNKRRGERLVSLREPVVRVIQSYIWHHRLDKHDEFGRSPLLTTHIKGRASKNAIRAWCYMATQPCAYMDCPHGYERPSCQFRDYPKASRCPSSKAPHHVRTGSISWHRDRGVPKEVTAERVNASEDVIDQYYDKSTKRERMQLRRQPHLHKLDIEDENPASEVDDE